MSARTITTSFDWLQSGKPTGITESMSAEEAALPSVWRVAVTLIGVMLVTFIIWSAFAPVEEVAKSSGQVIPSGYVQAIQHLEGGIVREIFVSDGQIVEKGQALVRFDGTSAKSDLGQVQARQQALTMQAARLRHFAADNGNKTTEPLSKEEFAILKSMEDARTNQRAVLNDQISQREKELRSMTASRHALQKNIAILGRETEIHQKMARDGIGAQLTALTSERELNQLRGQFEETKIQEQRARDVIAEARSRLQSLDSDLRQDAMKNLGQIEAELAEVNESLAKLKDTDNRTIVLAPVGGIVKGLNVHTEGAVVEPGKLLMEIVPLDKELMVEAMVSPADVGNLKSGQAVKVKVSAYDFARYGSISGKTESISASTFQTEKGDSFYKIKVKLAQDHVGRDPTRNRILPGMTVQADVVTGEKTVLQYLLKPIQTVMNNAFSER